jgi:hypothetical protein
MHFEDSGANGFELPGAAPSADTAFKDVAYDVTIAATHTLKHRPIRPLLRDAMSRYSSTRVRRRKPPPRVRSQVQGGPRGRATAHTARTKFAALAFE